MNQMRTLDVHAYPWRSGEGCAWLAAQEADRSAAK